MSRFKKIFVIIASVICVLVSAFLITVNSVKSNVSIAIGSPYSVVVFDHATTGSEFKDEDLFNNLDKKINETTSVSLFDKIINGFTLSKKIYQDSEKKYAKWSTDILAKNLVIEIVYNSMQDLVVYDGEYSRVISYYCLAFVIPDTSDFTEIPVYYSFTSNTDNNEKNNSYAECTPLVLCGEAEELSKFINTIKN